MIDLHSHVLPGLDDGAEDVAGAIAMARAAAADGVTALAATPHVRDDYPTTPEEMEVGVAALREALREAGVGIELLPGGEIAIDRLERLSDDELRRFALAGNPRYVLVEFPYVGIRLDLADRLFELRVRGVTPVVAHPERNTDVQRDATVVERLVAGGALVQVTAASLDGRLGRRTRAAALDLVERRLAHMIGSDAHAPGVRAVGMSAAADAVGDEELARWLTRDVPHAVVADEPIPPRPEPRRARRRRFGVF